MIKVLYVLCNFTWGGIEQYVLNMIDTINHDEFEIEVALPNGVFDRESELLSRNVPIKKYERSSLVARYTNFRDLVKEGKYDVVHFLLGHEVGLLVKACKLGGCNNIIVHAQSSDSGDPNRNALYLLKKKLVYSLLEHECAHNATCIACSDASARFLFGRYEKQAKIMRNGIYLGKFYQAKDVDRNRICINARYDTPKNPLFAIDVIAELVKLNPKIQVDWIGTGPLKDQILEKIRKNNLEDVIHLLGTCNHVEDIMCNSMWLLLPSQNEGLPLTIFEAQAAGMKCFISDGVPDGGNFGGCKVISLGKNATEWAKIMFEEMKNDLPVIDREALFEFDISVTVKSFEQLYYKLVNGER